MASRKLTDTFVRGLTAPTNTKKLLVRDTEVSRLQIQVTRDGAKSFVIRYSVNRHERLMTIGRFPTWPAAAAREQAKELLRLVDQGKDPLDQRNAARDAPTVKELASRYVEEHLPSKRPASAAADVKMINTIILPAFGAMKVGAVDSDDVAALHRKITKRGAPIRANRVFALLSKMFSLAIRWKMRTDNPCKGAVDRNPETQRKRYLSGEELARLTRALNDHRNQMVANAIRLLLLTGARKTEVLAARWEQFDLAERKWTKPAATTKQQREHVTFLSAPALQLLCEMEKTSKSEWLFPSRDASGHLTQIKAAWQQISKAARFDPPVRVHDLRHSFASILVSNNRSLELIGALLGHTQITTTQRYSHLHDAEQRAAVEEVGEVITGNRGGAQIHQIKRRRLI